MFTNSPATSTFTRSEAAPKTRGEVTSLAGQPLRQGAAAFEVTQNSNKIGDLVNACFTVFRPWNNDDLLREARNDERSSWILQPDVSPQTVTIPPQ